MGYIFCRWGKSVSNDSGRELMEKGGKKGGPKGGSSLSENGNLISPGWARPSLGLRSGRRRWMQVPSDSREGTFYDEKKLNRAGESGVEVEMKGPRREPGGGR